MKLLLLSQDLMATSHVSGVARQLGRESQIVRSTTDLLASLSPGDLIVVDLTLSPLDVQELVQAVHQSDSSVPIIAFGPHVHEMRLATAKEAGCDVVVSRGQWDRDAVSLCQTILEENSQAD